MNSVKISYSAVIRTLGTAGEHYVELLRSLENQSIPPEEIIVVLPKGYEPPPFKLGCERFVFCEKGMVHQRCRGIAESKSEYSLLLDDDLSFPPQLVERCYEELMRNEADVVAVSIYPRVRQKRTFAIKVKERVVDFLSFCAGLYWRSYRKSPFFIEVWGTGGFIVNKKKDMTKSYPSQSGNGACLFMKSEVAKGARLDDEAGWLDSVRYALPEDMCFLYKCYLSGAKIIYNEGIYCVHLDSKTSRKGQARQDRSELLYAMSRNYTIFWHRFLYLPTHSPIRRLIYCLQLMQRTVGLFFSMSIINVLRGKVGSLKFLYQGYKDAVSYIRSQPYRQLPLVVAVKGRSK